MSLKLLAIALSIASLTACKPDDFKALDLAEGHDAYGAAPKVEALVTDTSSSQPASSAAIIPSSSSSEAPPPEPPKEPCEPGTHGFRLWDCSPEGYKIYW